MQTTTHMHDVRVVPAPSGVRRQLMRCLPRDAARTALALRTARVERECPGSARDRHLDLVIPKPWGEEYRVYDDALLDAWLLEIDPGRRTSEHSHARKQTELLCLRGHGEVTGGDGRSRTIAPGAVVRIEQGAVHRTTAISALTLVEIETPRDKLDVVRLLDENGRAGRGYEQGCRDDPRLPALADVAGVAAGPPRARLRPRSIDGTLRFGVESTADVAARPRDLLFAIGLDSASVLRRRLRIAGPHDRPDRIEDRLHLTIRTNDRETTT